MLMPYANVHIKTASRLKVPITLRGDTKFIQDIFILHEYDPFLRHLKHISTWVDLGCNSGIVSLAIYDNIENKGQARGLLVDAGNRCIKAVKHLVAQNGLAGKFTWLLGLVGPSGQNMVFNEQKHGLISSAVIANRKETLRRMECVSIRDILNAHGLEQGTDLLKVDIEGSEKFLFPDEDGVFDLFRFTWLEYHKPHLFPETILALIEEKGYDVLVHEEHPNSGMILWRNPRR